MGWVERTIFGVLAASFILLVIAGGIAIYDDCKAEKFALRKDQWNCTGSRVETYTHPQMVGKIIIPIADTRTICTQWTER